MGTGARLSSDAEARAAARGDGEGGGPGRRRRGEGVIDAEVAANIANAWVACRGVAPTGTPLRRRAGRVAHGGGQVTSSQQCLTRVVERNADRPSETVQICYRFIRPCNPPDPPLTRRSQSKDGYHPPARRSSGRPPSSPGTPSSPAASPRAPPWPPRLRRLFANGRARLSLRSSRRARLASHASGCRCSAPPRAHI